MLLADLIQGKPNPWRELYDPNRVPIAGATRLLTENLDVAARFIADRFLSEASCLSEVGAGQGKIVDIIAVAILVRTLMAWGMGHSAWGIAHQGWMRSCDRAIVRSCDDVHVLN